jgi:sarcosine oxidase subunit gamma
VTVDLLWERRMRLAGWSVGSPDRVRCAVLPAAALVSLRVDPAGEWADRVGVPLPGRGGVAAEGEHRVLWLGPDEFLVVGPDGDPALGPDGGGAALAARLGAAVGDGGCAVDVSAERTGVSVTGPHARDVLAKGCPLDLHPRVFGPGRCAQSLLGRLRVLVWRPADGGFRLLVRGSYADHLAAWLTDTTAEYRDV